MKRGRSVDCGSRHSQGFSITNRVEDPPLRSRGHPVAPRTILLAGQRPADTLSCSADGSPAHRKGSSARQGRQIAQGHKGEIVRMILGGALSPLGPRPIGRRQPREHRIFILASEPCGSRERSCDGPAQSQRCAPRRRPPRGGPGVLSRRPSIAGRQHETVDLGGHNGSRRSARVLAEVTPPEARQPEHRQARRDDGFAADDQRGITALKLPLRANRTSSA